MRAMVLAYWFAARGGWLKRLLAVSAILALVPMGNHLFVLENWSYYARWFYMPTLMMVLATAIALERMRRKGRPTGPRGRGRSC